jgi:transcriptional regulator with XRE-family HTH domain
LLNPCDKEEIQQMYLQIGQNVKKIRNMKNRSQLDLALSIGHSTSGFLGKAEIGLEGKHFNLEQLHKIAKVLEVDICEFFKPIDKIQ